MSTEDRDETHSLRWLALTSDALADLRTLAPEVRARPSPKQPERHVAVLPLRPDGDYAWAEAFHARHAIADNERGFYFSLSTDADSSGLSVPAYAVALLRTLGGTLEFSFTVS